MTLCDSLDRKNDGNGFFSRTFRTVLFERMGSAVFQGTWKVRKEGRKGRLEEIEATYVCFISVSVAPLSTSSVEPLVLSIASTLYFQKAPSSP